MTNGEIVRMFEERHPEIEIDDYRPISQMFLDSAEQGIIIWLKNGDKIIYFPKN